MNIHIAESANYLQYLSYHHPARQSGLFTPPTQVHYLPNFSKKGMKYHQAHAISDSFQNFIHIRNPPPI